MIDLLNQYFFLNSLSVLDGLLEFTTLHTHNLE